MKDKDQFEVDIEIRDLNKSVKTNNGLTLLETLLKHNIPARYKCKNGICGSCRFKIVSGDVVSEPDFCLSDNEVSDGIRLACCTRFESNNAIIILNL